ncbi:FdhF/YdeP family oxidoreductase [Sphingomonas nostoxanthinifaciens]|uniref:FdhF/YdeP family oxidoreductase n=1 Tax=Sphingomonas nostoxanthinifaciens TaxID=2872652 RepID=UPI001CC1E76A|nr:FdhF/YdeP family oxidoreductase [Sphingomonas nostoxanthinifaciens]UAK25895.1 FdhF/YdeP family oxidoreductase [Sphingomonas nostoxanthinifaciens]
MSDLTPSTDDTDRTVPGVEPYDGPAGGWGALKAVALAVREQMGASTDTRALLQMNQPDGFDCPGCAWPDPKKTSSFEFCENGAKAVTWEATAKRVDLAFFKRHSATELYGWSDYDLENAGRLTHPLRYDAASDHFVPITYDEAYARIGAGLNALADPNQAEFYCSGRASNEAAFLYQLFARAFGTNNFPDCSNMCHEATSVGLPKSIGIGKGTVTLDDFELADAIFCIGHNPGTNHPRMLSTLSDAAKRGVPIVVANPMRERGLERFKSPQHPSEMLTTHSTELASAYHQVRVGGDSAMLKGMMKALFEADAADLDAGGQGLLDRPFIAEHTVGVDELRADVEAVAWDEIVTRSGLTRDAIESMARTYWQAERVILCYGMGITQHSYGTSNVQQLANLLLLRGNMGKPGAGICPLRGHSNVQGDRTVGITEIPTEAMLQRLDARFGIKSPRAHGHNAVEALAAMRDGHAKALISLGGNLAVAMPDPEASFAAFRKLDLSVSIITKFNRTCLLLARETIVLPCLGRTELDVQAGGSQYVTVEDSMSMVHASRGRLKPASPDLHSEPAIVAGIAKATLPHVPIAWDAMIADYDLIRDGIEAVYPDFYDFNVRVRQKGGFRLTVGASERVWNTPDKKAHFIVHPLAGASGAEGALLLTTVRSHDQYNTTIYGLNDRYRGVTGRRDVIFANADDLAELGLSHGDRVDIDAGPGRTLDGYTVVAHAISRGSLAAYYPEANCLVPLEDHDPLSGTPSYKSVRVTMRAAATPHAVAA